MYLPQLGRSAVLSCLLLTACVSTALAEAIGTALIRRAPTLNGTIEGSVHQLTPENTTLNGGAAITGDLLVPGTPVVRLNGRPNYGGTIDGTGAASPSNFTITLNGNATLRHVVRRAASASLPVVTAPPNPTGTRSIALNNSSQNPGNFATLRNLTLNSNVGQISVPPGTYGNFIANGGSGFILGMAGTTQPTHYNFQNLTLNGNSAFNVIGPVIVTIAGSFSINGNMGAAARPEWLKLRIANGGLSMNGNVTFYGYVEAPSGTVTLNANSRLTGGVASDRLIVNGNSVLRLITPTANQAPSVALSAMPARDTYVAPASFTLNAAASDNDGAVARVEFYEGTTKIGEDTIAPFTLEVVDRHAGSYTFLARAVDDLGATADSAVLMLTVIAPNHVPTVDLTAPPDGSLYIAPANLAIAAAASDADGAIAKVEFYRGTEKLGEDFTAPYEEIVNGLSAGTYTFTARAVDNLGAAALSDGITVTVLNPNQPPVVTLIAPADGSVFVAPAAFLLVASAIDPDGTIASVEFYHGTTKLGEATAPPYQLSISDLDSGIHTFLARAYDNAGSATESAPVVITVMSPNQPPSVNLTTPSDGAIFTTPAAAITLAATAADADGTIAKIEFYQGNTKLGEVASAPYTLTWTDVPPGSYALTARAIDNAGASTTSEARNVTVRVGLPYFTGFETSDGFALGPLAGQTSWAAAEQVDVAAAISASGQHSILLAPSQPPAQAAHAFPPYTGQNVVFLDLFARPAAGAMPANSILLETETARVAFVRAGGQGELHVFNGDGVNGGAWLPTGFKTGLTSSGESTDWLRLTLREDFSAKRWDLYADGKFVAHDQGFLDSTKTLFGQFTFTGHPTASTVFDDFYIGFDNPLFTDADKDGMDDAWEIANELDASINDRNGDRDGDGVSNIAEFKQSSPANDFYNGAPPILISLMNGTGHLDASGALTVRVTRADGTILTNAPLTFAVTTGATTLSSSQGEGAMSPLPVRTDAQGVARVYLNFVASTSEVVVVTAASGSQTATLSILVQPPVQPPAVAITSPALGATFTAPASITIDAMAVSGSGAIAKVEFYAGSTKIGEAIHSPYAFAWSGVVAGAYNITAVATDAAGLTTLSPIVTIQVNAPTNASPSVSLMSPPNHARFDVGFPLLIRAMAFDSDGTIARVEFYGGGTKIGEATTAPYELAWAATSPGDHTLSAIAYDNLGALQHSDAHNIILTYPLPPLYAASFEAEEGFTTGPLQGQGNWVLESDGIVEVTATDAHLGAQSVVFRPAANPPVIVRELPPIPADQPVVFFDFWAKPAAGVDFFSASQFDLGGARFALVASGTHGRIQVFEPTPDWFSLVDTVFTIPLSSDGVARDWIRFTIRQSYKSDSLLWDLFADGSMVSSGVRFFPQESPRLSVTGDSHAIVRFDQLSVLSTNPLFADVDTDGMDDNWEFIHQLDPTFDDREADKDGDGLTNVREYMLSTVPANPDTDGDGLPDGWEVNHVHNPLEPEPAPLLSSDVDGDGLTFLQEGQAGSDPNNPDTDSDGLSDDVEVSSGLSPLIYDADDDTDGDSTSNQQEIVNGTSPTDYYNGQQPIVTSLLSPDGALVDGDHIAVRVTNQAGDPLVNAPVIFTARSADHAFSPTSSNRWSRARRRIEIRSDYDGIARAYVVRADELLRSLQ